MAGTSTTPPPMPRSPTSTPTPSPSKRMSNVIVFRARRKNHRAEWPCHLYLLLSYAERQLPCTCTIFQAAHLFLPGTCYICLLRCNSWLFSGLIESIPPAKMARINKKISFSAPYCLDAESEECKGTHAHRKKIRVFQRRTAQGGHYWLRLRGLAAGPAVRRSGPQGHRV